MLFDSSSSDNYCKTMRQDEEPLTSLPRPPKDSLEAQALNACEKLQRKMSANNIDLLKAC